MSKIRTATSGIVAAAAIATLFTAAPASAAPIPGCASYNVCIDLDWRDGNFYQVTGYHNPVGGNEKYGHIHLTGPGGLDLNSNDKLRPIISGSGVGPGQACAQMWVATGGGNYYLLDTACVTI